MVLAPVVLLGMKAMPPSPRWLLLRAQRAKPSGLDPLGQQNPLRVAALASLRRFRRGLPEELVEAEFSGMESTLLFEAAEASAGSFGEVRHERPPPPPHRHTATPPHLLGPSRPSRCP